MTALPGEAYAAALAGLPHLTPARLRALLARMEPSEAWRAVLAQRAFPSGFPTRATTDDAIELLGKEAAKVDPAELWDRCLATGTTVSLLGGDAYPKLLAQDPFAPAVLFSRGDFGALAARRVAIVGTRQATAVGREMAVQLGAELARNGVAVVSGLAAGIDGAAHRGVLSVAEGASPVGVVGSGLDVPYPSGHHKLWQEVADKGLLLAEVPPGSIPLAHRFPQRNRVIAALAEIVVVVESRERGGSLLTVNEADRRGRTIMAVPGSPRNPVACGTNELLRDGCLPVHDVSDILMQLGLGSSLFASPTDHRPPPAPLEQGVLDLMSDRPLSLEELVSASGLSVPQVAVALARLEIGGWIVETAGCFERVHVPTQRRGIR